MVFNLKLNVPRGEKTGLQGFRLGLTLIELYKQRRWLESGNQGFRIMEEEELYYPSSENKGAN